MVVHIGCECPVDWNTKEQKIDEELRKAWKNELNSKARFAPDGVVDASVFQDQSLHYIFVLKEVNDLVLNTDDQGLIQGGLRRFLRIGAATCNNGNGGHTWTPVCRWLSGGVGNISYSPEQRKSILSAIAAINLKKIDTAEGVSNMPQISRYYQDTSKGIAFRNQMESIIELAKGKTLIICCGRGVYKHLKNLILKLEKEDDEQIDEKGFRRLSYVSWTKDSWLLDFYHPNARRGGLAYLFNRCIERILS